ncbi:MAG: sulfocyanin-like copper-binding protein [Gemmatimonadota bacterium]|nr:sulfocyanin-like copper-binding protein [Gemmatimonadota bacterium]
MKRFFATGTTGLALAVTACGGGGDAGGEAPAPAPAPAPAAAPSAAPSSADWIVVDEDAGTVTIDLIAGETDANNRWNFNGYVSGEATVVVPEGFEVTINFENLDPVNMHSVGVLEPMGSYPAMFENPTPVFDGAITSNATSMTEATAPGGGSETITFTAGSAGEYALVCLIPAHATSGMYIGFEVSASGESGLRM